MPPAGDGFDELDEAWLRSKGGAKWSAAGAGVLPCWVADMDFPAPAPVREALVRLATVADLGYPVAAAPAVLEQAWAGRVRDRYGWTPQGGRLRNFSNLVQAAQVFIEAGSSPGDGVMLMVPSYPPFVESVPAMGRKLVAVPAIADGAGWSFDLETAAARAAEARILLLVNPHNPTGRMLTREELEALAEMAERHDLLVISDEIHADLALTGRPHIPFASLSPELEARTVTLYSASKSYNLGGMACAVAHVGHAGMQRHLAALPSHLLGHVGRAGMTATLAAWSPTGDAWLERCLARLRANRLMLEAWLAAPGAGAAAGVRGYAPEGTYLAWLDFRAAGLGEDPAHWLLDNARVMFGSGGSFGPGGQGFARLNFATSPGILAQILDRTAASLQK